MTYQLIINGFIVGSLYALAGLGFTIEYKVTRFFNFAYAAVFAVAPYGCWALLAALDAPPRAVASPSFLLAGFSGILFAAWLSWVLEIIVFRQLRRRYVALLVMLLASLGTYIVIQNVISLLAGDDIKVIDPGIAVEGVALSIPGLGIARITSLQIGTVVIATVLGVGVSLALRLTTLGRQLRAVANDPELATIVGINSDAVHALVHVLGGMLGGLAALCLALQEGLMPSMGFGILLKVSAAMIIGGMGSLPGVVVGALIVGLLESLSVTLFDTKWQDAMVFSILLGFLFFRPQGLFGRPSG